MRTQLVTVKNITEAKKAMPWASRIVRVEGGYRGFESVTDYKTWKNQK